jgi:hypothetical protein
MSFSYPSISSLLSLREKNHPPLPRQEKETAEPSGQLTVPVNLLNLQENKINPRG